jgi:hypothetical protein
MGIRGSFVHVSKGGEHWQRPVNSSRTLLARPRLLLHRIGVSSRVAGSPPRISASTEVVLSAFRAAEEVEAVTSFGARVVMPVGSGLRGPAGQNFTSKT